MADVDGRLNAMRTTIDGAGRVVVPKRIRDAAGLIGGAEVEIEWDGEAVRLSVPAVEVGPEGLSGEEDGLSLEEILAAIDAQRR